MDLWSEISKACRERAIRYRGLAQEARRQSTGTKAVEARNALLEISRDSDRLAVEMDSSAEKYAALAKNGGEPS